MVVKQTENSFNERPPFLPKSLPNYGWIPRVHLLMMWRTLLPEICTVFYKGNQTLDFFFLSDTGKKQKKMY